MGTVSGSKGGVVRLHARPAGVRVAEEGMAGVADSLLEAKLAAARQEGAQQGSQEIIEGAARALEGAADRFEQFVENSQKEVTAFAIELGVEIAGVLLKRELDAGELDVEKLVRNTLAASKVGRGECVVHVSPADHARLAGVPFRKGTNIVSDPDIAPGHVEVETPQGLLVHDPNAALAAIREELLGHLS